MKISSWKDPQQVDIMRILGLAQIATTPMSVLMHVSKLYFLKKKKKKKKHINA